MPVYGGPPQVLTPDVLNALLGTHGLPADANRYVTDSDPRMQALTALTALLAGSSNARIKTDGTLQLKNKDTGLFDTPSTNGGDFGQSLQFEDHSQL